MYSVELNVAGILKNHTNDIWACDFLQLYDALFRPIFAFFIVALAAGTDVLLVCSSLELARQARLGLEQALTSGRLPTARVREALARIRRLRTHRSAYPPIRRWPVAAHVRLARRLRASATAYAERPRALVGGAAKPR